MKLAAIIGLTHTIVVDVAADGSSASSTKDMVGLGRGFVERNHPTTGLKKAAQALGRYAKLAQCHAVSGSWQWLPGGAQALNGNSSSRARRLTGSR